MQYCRFVPDATVRVELVERRYLTPSAKASSTVTCNSSVNKSGRRLRVLEVQVLPPRSIRAPNHPHNMSRRVQ